jgi:ribosomal protein S27AE
MAMPLRTDVLADCPRCATRVHAVWPWRHWGRLRYIYFGVLGLCLVASPVILADGFIMIPTMMVWMAAIGPINRLAAKKPTCARCGGIVTAVEPGSTGPARPPELEPAG